MVLGKVRVDHAGGGCLVRLSFARSLIPHWGQTHKSGQSPLSSPRFRPCFCGDGFFGDLFGLFSVGWLIVAAELPFACCGIDSMKQPFVFRSFKRRIARVGEVLSEHLQWIVDILLAHAPARDAVLARYRSLAATP